MTIAYLTNISSPYRVAMMEAWARHLGADLQMRLRTYYTDEGDQGRGWEIRSAENVEETRLSTIVSVPGYGRLTWGLLRMVRDNQIIMIGGFEQASYLVAAILARATGRKVILLFDGFSPKRIGTDRAHVRWVKWMTAKLCHAYFANGIVGRDFLVVELGIEERRIFNQYLSISTADIDQERAKLDSRALARDALDLPPDRRVAAFCGYIIPRKRPELILDAVAGLSAEDRPAILFIGRGPLQGSLQEQARRLGLDIVFSGFQQGPDLARHYLAADFLILPSDDDAWGLVVNEAMAAGLPVISSDACGATRDLVIDGLTGFGFKAGDAGDLRRAMTDLFRLDPAVMREAAMARVAEWTPDHSARSLCACVRMALRG